MLGESEAPEARSLNLPDELSDSTAPQTIANTALHSSLQKESQRVYEIFEEKQDDQAGLERGRKDKGTTLADCTELVSEEATNHDGGERGGNATKWDDSLEEPKEPRSKVEAQDLGHLSQATVFKGQHATAAKNYFSRTRGRRGNNQIGRAHV